MALDESMREAINSEALRRVIEAMRLPAHCLAFAVLLVPRDGGEDMVIVKAPGLDDEQVAVLCAQVVVTWRDNGRLEVTDG